MAAAVRVGRRRSHPADTFHRRDPPLTVLTDDAVLVEVPQLGPPTGVAERALGEHLERLTGLDVCESRRHRARRRRHTACAGRQGVVGDEEYAGARTIGAPAATLGVNAAVAASPAAIQRARPENIARRGSPTARCPFACSRATTTHDTSPAHSSQATISRARLPAGRQRPRSRSARSCRSVGCCRRSR